MISPLDPETVRADHQPRKGARYDAPLAPALELRWARQGAAYFARKLNDLTDDEFDAPTLMPSWSRRQLIGHVGHQARALSRIVEAARTGQSHSIVSKEECLAAKAASTLPAWALRNLFRHSESHLNVEWRDLDASTWNAAVVLTDGRSVPVRETPANRALAVWIHAVDLNTTGSFRDFPADFLEWLAVDRVPQMLAQSGVAGFLMMPTDRQCPVAIGNGAGHVIEGSMADLLQWLLGRGAPRLRPAMPELLGQSIIHPVPFREASDP